MSTANFNYTSKAEENKILLWRDMAFVALVLLCYNAIRAVGTIDWFCALQDSNAARKERPCCERDCIRF